MKSNEEGVSPVVGVMLMLVVTIIIAAVVSAFATGIASTETKAPQLTLNTKITNTGYGSGSYVQMSVTGVSEPIPTKDLTLKFSWRKGTASNSSTITGQSSTPNAQFNGSTFNAPIGFGPGVENWETDSYSVTQHYGNFTLNAGTSMKAAAYGSSIYGGYGVVTQYEYSSGTGYTVGQVDCISALLGTNWNLLRLGDVVCVKILHNPSGKIIYNEKVVVVG